MSGCCDPRGCDGIFGSRYAKSRAAAYRRRGLDDDATRMVDYAAARGLDGATVLEIGGGVGEIQLELLRRGAASAVSVELVDAYDRVAEELLASAGLSGRVQRRVLDIAVSPHEVQPADIVVLHRVVCCYPDYGRLLASAASHARRVLVFSHPTRNLGTRAVISSQNALLRLGRKSFRTFTHSPEDMLEVPRALGMTGGPVPGGIVWKVAGLERVG